MKIDCKEVARGIKIPHFFNDKHNTLVTLVVGNKPTPYCKFKTKELERNNFRHEIILVNPFIKDNPQSKMEIINKVKELNENKGVIGIMVELPIPKTLEFLRDIINPKKDIDCITTYNLGRLMSRRSPYHLPCTSMAIMQLIDNFRVTHELTNMEKFKDVLLIGKGNVATPLHQILLQKGYTVTQIHKHSDSPKIMVNKLKPHIVITATGSDLGYLPVPNRTKLVIDVGTRLEDGKLKTDIDKSSYCMYDVLQVDYTSLPNGLGSITTKMLLDNLVKSCILTT